MRSTGATVSFAPSNSAVLLFEGYVLAQTCFAHHMREILWSCPTPLAWHVLSYAKAPVSTSKIDNAPWQCPAASRRPSGDQHKALIAPAATVSAGVINRCHEVVRFTTRTPSRVTIATMSICGQRQTSSTFMIRSTIGIAIARIPVELLF